VNTVHTNTTHKLYTLYVPAVFVKIVDECTAFMCCVRADFIC